MPEFTGTGGNDVLTGGFFDDILRGLGGDDVLRGNGGQDGLLGGPGNDILDGGTNNFHMGDLVVYLNSGARSVNVDLARGTANDGLGGIDTLIGIEGVVGTEGNDFIFGDDTSQSLFIGLGGSDLIDGRGNTSSGVDTVDYSFDPAGVNADLFTGIAWDGFGAMDTLRNIEIISGSNFADIIRGDNGNNTLIGNAGNDVLDGRGGNDYAGFFALNLFTGVTVNLATGTASDGFGGTDTLISIENVLGTNSADRITGNHENNMFAGLGGDDNITGGGGIDVSQYAQARSFFTINSASGNLTVNSLTSSFSGGSGRDTLTGIERLEFLDGTLAFDNLRSDMAGKSYLLYRAALDRAPDPQGLGYWVDRLDANADFVREMAASFLTSTEFVNKYGANVSNAQFINLLYQNVMDRAPDQAGSDYWLAQLNGGFSRASLLASFAISDENYNNVAPLIRDGIWFA